MTDTVDKTKTITVTYRDARFPFHQGAGDRPSRGPRSFTIRADLRGWLRNPPSAFAKKAADRFLDLARGEALGKQAALQLHPLQDFVPRAFAQQPLGLTKRLRRFREKRFDDLVRQLRVERAVRGTMADEADVQRFVGAERLRPAGGSAQRGGGRRAAARAASSPPPAPARDRRTASRSARCPRRSPGRNGAAWSCRCRRNCHGRRRRSAISHWPAPAAAATPGFVVDPRGMASRKSARSLPAAKSCAFAVNGDDPDARDRPPRLRSASASAAYMATVMALRRSGRASVIASMPPLALDPHMLAHRLPLPNRMTRFVAPAMRKPIHQSRGARKSHEILRRHRRNRRNPRARRHRAARRRDHQPVAGPQVRPRFHRSGAARLPAIVERAGLGRGRRARS